MNITEDQWLRLGRESFEARMIAIIRKAWPAQSAGVSDAAFGDIIAPLLQRANGYGLVDERSVGTFVLSAWLFGESFDSRIRVVSQVLNDAGSTPEVKARFLDDFNVVVFDRLKRGTRPAAVAA